MSAAAAFAMKGAIAGLLAGQLALAAVRLPHAARRAEAVWFMLLLAALLALAVAGAARPGGLIAASVLAWACGAYLVARDGQVAAPPWHAAAAVVTAGIVACSAAGWTGSRLWLVPWAATAALTGYPLYRLFARRPAGAGAPGRYRYGIGLLPVAGALIDQLPRMSAAAPLSAAVLSAGVAALGCGYLLAELDYLRAPARSSDGRRYRGPDEDQLLLHDRLAIAGYLTAGVAHEFKNILAHIKVAAEWGADGGEPRRALQLIRSHAGAGATGVNEMLTTTLRDGPEPRSAVPVRSEVDKILGLVSAALQTAHVTIRLRVAAHLAPVTRKRELMLVLLNLIRNAGQATAERNPAGGEIVVTGRREGGLCILEVIDAAGGVDPAVAGRLFDRGSGTGSGSGLGLHLAHRLVRRNHGALTYHAIPGGSCFRITLPMDPAARRNERRPVPGG